ncbi:MAG: urea ABC transporter substrate-binding protein, partial [Gammaproteobacteria bacterium]
MERRSFIKKGVAAAVAGAIPAPFIWPRGASAAPTVKMGILHSLTGTIAIAEKSVVDAEMLAVEEINAAGGVNGHMIEAVVEDGASDWPTFAEKARKLISKDKVAAVQGCYTSASRKAVLPVFEKEKGLLYYPTYYEGLEISPNIMYTAQEATQSSIAATEWLVKNKGDTFYMVGSDYIWPRTTIKLSNMTLKRLGGKSLGETFFPLGHIEWSSAINKIKASRPKVVLNCVVGGSNVAFFKQMKAAGIIDDPEITVLSLAVSEEEVSGIGRENAAGTLNLKGYFQSLDNAANKKFVSAFKAKYGQDRVTGDTLACGYTGVYLWAKACEKAGSFAVNDVIAASSERAIDGP